MGNVNEVRGDICEFVMRIEEYKIEGKEELE